jgi:hypothetical protein
MFMWVLTRQDTQREAAAKWGMDRCTVVHVCRAAKQGALAASVPGRGDQPVAMLNTCLLLAGTYSSSGTCAT